MKARDTAGGTGGDSGATPSDGRRLDSRPAIRLEAIDLNLLVSFDALMAEENVTRAAARVGVSQPAMSNALARLREILGDPLLQRAGGRMQATARARSMTEPVSDALARMRRALDTRPEFDPQTAIQEFRFGTTDYVEAVLLAPLLARLANAAPGVSVRTVRPSSLFYVPAGELQCRDVDLSIGFGAPVNAAAGVMSVTLMDEQMICILRRGHPAAPATMDLATFTELRHVRVLYAQDEQLAMTDTSLRARGLHRSIGASVPHLLSVPDIVAATDLLGIVPRRLAERRGGDRAFHLLELPISLTPLKLNLFWHERASSDPAHAWLREQIIAVAADVASEPR